MAEQDNNQTFETESKTHIRGQQDTYGSKNYTKDSDADERETFSPDPNVDDTQDKKPFGLSEKDEYGLQDQFGDVDDQDPYSNLEDDQPEKENAGEDPDPDALYGLEAPLAGPGDVSRAGSTRTRQNTRINADDQGYNQ
ncbi:hypothetical protein [Dictyobacter kobayashii]|uniref:Uncharacterized protein n=1 Tax=Dictyobacter kobayashii TaxID=2014872 RepID=A0A402AY32_9CHLR|nr:hypothetical protein [Dictyobacter kobayashii]GCE23974.1 hypothetical protein KDK_77740 [Dictyobacter kobayashii]